ncbi:surface glycoprotein, partial [Haloplanus litoreus]
MTDSKQKIRAVVLAALMVFSVFAGTVALSGTVAAQSAGSGNNTITPTSVAQDTTNDYDITVNATEVDTTDGSVNGDFVVDFKSLNLTTSSVITGTSIDAGNVTIDSPNTTVADGTETATLAFNDSTSDGLASDTVQISFTVTNVESPTAGDQNVDYDFDDGEGTTFSGQALDTVTVNAPSSANRAGNVDGSGTFDTLNGTGTVFDGATVYQGESGLSLGGSLAGETLVKTAGDAEGVPLELPDIPQSQETGRYTTNGASGSPGVTVTTPRVTTLDVVNTNGN